MTDKLNFFLCISREQQAKKNRQSKNRQSDDEEDQPAELNTGFSEEEENGDWESGSDDSDEEKLESTKIKTTKATEDDIISGELEGLKETAELFKSNIFKLEVTCQQTTMMCVYIKTFMQIDELLAEITMNFDKHKALEKALHNLKAIFDTIPNGKSMKVQWIH